MTRGSPATPRRLTGAAPPNHKLLLTSTVISIAFASRTRFIECSQQNLKALGGPCRLREVREEKLLAVDQSGGVKDDRSAMA